MKLSNLKCRHDAEVLLLTVFAQAENKPEKDHHLGLTLLGLGSWGLIYKAGHYGLMLLLGLGTAPFTAADSAAARALGSNLGLR
jgi:hypothetical protein